MARSAVLAVHSAALLLPCMLGGFGVQGLGSLGATPISDVGPASVLGFRV